MNLRSMPKAVFGGLLVGVALWSFHAEANVSTVAVTQADFEALDLELENPGDPTSIDYNVDTNLYVSEGASARLNTTGTKNTGWGQVVTNADVTGYSLVRLWAKGSDLNSSYAKPSVLIDDTEHWVTSSSFDWAQLLFYVGDLTGAQDIALRLWGGGTSWDYRKVWYDEVVLTDTGPASTVPLTNWVGAVIECITPQLGVTSYLCIDPAGDQGTGATGDWNRVVSLGDSSGNFAYQLTGMDAEQDYHIRLYFDDTDGTGDEAWSELATFTTQDEPPATTSLTIEADQVIDGDGPSLEFKETPDHPLAGIGVSPNWLYDFSLYDGVQTVNLDAYTLLAESAPSSGATFTFNLAGASLVGTNELAIRSWKGEEKRHAHNVLITNVNQIAMGGIDARTTYSSGGSHVDSHAGDVTIGEESFPAQDDVRVGYIHTSADRIAGHAGDVAIFGSGDVMISDEMNTGDILTCLPRYDSDSFYAGDVNVMHDGDFGVRNIETWNRGNGPSGIVMLDGGSAAGSAVVEGDIQTVLTNASRVYHQSSIEFKNYNNVTIEGSILAQFNGTSFVGDANRVSDLTITNNITGNIDIQGAINLWATNDVTRNGRAELACDGYVTLAELDLDKVGYAYLSSGGSEITGALSNFDTNIVSGNGTSADPYVPDETRLRAPEGQVVYYTYTPGVLNDNLGGDVWQIKDLDGETDGGLLMVEQPSGTIFIVR